MTQPVHSLLPNRKRSRNHCEEESSEFTPLSKRINNLHINNAVFPLNKHAANHPKYQDEAEAMRLLGWEGNDMDVRMTHTEGGGLHRDSAVSVRTLQSMPIYNPDLSPAENPYYYENNKLLFTLYMERLQRTGQSLY